MRILRSFFVAALCFAATMRGGEVQFRCNYSFSVNTRFVEGPEDPAVYGTGIYGQFLLLAVPDLAPGRYSLELPLVETDFTIPGQRLFDILCGGKLLAADLDLVKVAGGPYKGFVVKGDVDHAGGLLRIELWGKKENAKFNALRVRNAAGTLVAQITAAAEIAASLEAADAIPAIQGRAWMDPSRTPTRRAKDLVAHMTLREKAQQLSNAAPGILRLGVPPYNYWSEALHGVARNGTATSFPQCVGMAASWDTPLIKQVGDVISTEGRAKFHEAERRGDLGGIYKGLTFWCPNINLIRDPRWGRSHESWGEDPFLLGRYAVALISGIQGDDPVYFKAIATPKHFAVHSGPEGERHRMDARPSERDLYESYLPHFEAAIREGHAWSIMGAYTRFMGEPCNGSSFLLQKTLRERWGFKGFVVSDCWAIDDFWKPGSHLIDRDPVAAAVRAITAGCDSECNECYAKCGSNFITLHQAVRYGLIDVRLVDQAVERCFEARIRLGLFDSPDRVPYTRIPLSANESPANAAVALKVAREAMTLLKNDGQVLPLSKSIKTLAVIGPNADSVPVLRGNYYGEPSHPVTILAGLRAKLAGQADIRYLKGCDLVEKKDGTHRLDPAEAAKAVALAKDADAVVFVGGISGTLEGEEGAFTEMLDAFNAAGLDNGDRTSIELPAVQTELLKLLKATGKPLVFVLCTGSSLAMPWEVQNIPSILCAWYPGQAGGTAVADALFGDTNPAGRLPVTFYRATTDLPAFADYSMRGRTYRYCAKPVQWPFGFGLSYTRFEYKDVTLSAKSAKPGDTVSLSVQITNAGPRDGDEVVQVYARDTFSPEPRPLQRLVGFTRVTVGKGRTVTAKIPVRIDDLRYWDIPAKDYRVYPGSYELRVGASSADIKGVAMLGVQ